MDQARLERMLRVMQRFTGNTKYTLEEISRDLRLSTRTLFRYIATFRAAGFSVLCVDVGVYQMTSYNKEFADLSQLVYFSREEAVIVSRLIENLSQTNEVKAALRRKLAAVYDSTSIGNYIENRGKDNVMETLFLAMKSHRQIALRGYSSANSDKTKDYVIEPYDFTKEYVDERASPGACETAAESPCEGADDGGVSHYLNGGVSGQTLLVLGGECQCLRGGRAVRGRTGRPDFRGGRRAAEGLAAHAGEDDDEEIQVGRKVKTKICIQKEKLFPFPCKSFYIYARIQE